MKKEMEPGCTVSTTNSWKIAESRRSSLAKIVALRQQREKESNAAEDVDEDTCEEKKNG